jgi:Ca2+-binding RTX toxin-like protein
LGLDKIYGGAGDDIINGGIGNDLLWGGDGSDTFQLNDGIGTDIVKDFVIGEDSLEVMSGSLGISMTQAGNHTMIYQGDDLLAFIGNVIADDLTINNNLIA